MLRGAGRDHRYAPEHFTLPYLTLHDPAQPSTTPHNPPRILHNSFTASTRLLLCQAHFVVHMPLCLPVLFGAAGLLHSNWGGEGTVTRGFFPWGCKDIVARGRLLCKGEGGYETDDSHAQHMEGSRGLGPVDRGFGTRS